ncbi:MULTISPECIES: phosphotransferase family protein [unclassified Bradyrhizobium]|uniref:phosphotransferase family protein n=1 Tax=unclassified Bradyrhizobium TaxID=2631580 RepID=UPI001BA5DD8E|nr:MULTISPECIES: phosphotransferase family protein [unclassified Bradyrhizobium]MBR1202964.1 phosphotransferase family protein [Bradyrhizobium sp. AUGA SZCCT0124]MBR1314378.1 phosphotransferase family protein [Bradyrhizobium sp. AUGA SZCCT0051]MBR1342604.1 phosphotransferase family protein [Bradyrhizobium sp. AUGA SZCCT0105]MBR1352833.1 phosphotransferase family protein [Bradyrhizobium sp. AUGA SZCCT0045]
MIQPNWRELVDFDKLTAWMDGLGLESGPIVDAVPLAGGTQNILLRFKRGGRTFVLRRPPSHPRMDGNFTNRREARMLGALANTDVPHPRLIAACDTPDVLGGTFYLMESIDGFNAGMALPQPFSESADLRRQMGFSIIDALLSLGCVDHVAVGLGDFGKLDGFLERQTPRWRAQLESYREYDGWPGPQSLKHVDEIGKWLSENQPKSFQPGILHGDYHLSNVLYRSDVPQVAAIVDWELATIGDPLVDLGWIMATWPDPEGRGTSGTRVKPWGGFPVIGELIEYYGKHTARDVSNIAWYGVLGCYKLGLILEGTFARACAGKAPVETGERLHNSCVALLERAVGMIERR